MRTQIGISTEKSGLIPEFFLKKVIKLIKNTWINMAMIFAVFALFTGIAGAQNALPNFPVGLQGSISIGGNPAPPDTEIIAKVGDAVVGKTKVQSAGMYGDGPFNKLGVFADDGATVDIYVNGAKVSTFTYHLKDAGKIFPVDLKAPGSGNSATGGGDPSPTATPAATAKSVSVVGGGDNPGGGGGGGGGNGQGSGTGKEGSLTPTTIQPAATPKESLPGTKEIQVTPAVPPTADFKFFVILGVFAVSIAGVMVGLVLKKRNKL